MNLIKIMKMHFTKQQQQQQNFIPNKKQTQINKQQVELKEQLIQLLKQDQSKKCYKKP